MKLDKPIVYIDGKPTAAVSYTNPPLTPANWPKNNRCKNPGCWCKR